MVSKPTVERSVPLEKPFLAIDANFKSSMHPIDLQVESIINWTNDLFGPEHIVKAKEEFFWKTGKIFHDEFEYHNRMSYFIDFYVFQRILEAQDPKFQGQTPFMAYAELNPTNASMIHEFRHSIFKIQKINEKHLTIKDLITKTQHKISKRDHEIFVGIEKSSLFQGFVYFSKNKIFISRGLIFHPKESASLVNKSIKILKKIDDFDEVKFLCQTAKCQLKRLRHPHIDLKTFYDHKTLMS